MDVLGRGLLAGFLTALALSALLEPIALAARVNVLSSVTLGWSVYFLIGSAILGASFALLHPLLRGPCWLRGLLFGFAAWLIVMLGVMPLSRAGWIALNLGFTGGLMTLVAHLVFGVALGIIFDLLGDEPHEHRKGNLRTCSH